MTPHSSSREAVKMGLLFLTRGDLNHANFWQAFLESTGGSARVFSHAKHPELLRSPALLETGIRIRHATEWGHVSLVRAMLALLREAMKDESLTHFSFLSENCIPVKSWGDIRTKLEADPRSMIQMEGPDRMAPFHLNRFPQGAHLDPAHWRIHPQWVLLDRAAAACVLRSDETGEFENVFAADEHYFGTILASGDFPTAHINPVSCTWVQWDAWGPCHYREVSPDLVSQLAASPCFFARKFPPGARIDAIRVRVLGT